MTEEGGRVDDLCLLLGGQLLPRDERKQPVGEPPIFSESVPDEGSERS